MFPEELNLGVMGRIPPPDTQQGFRRCQNSTSSYGSFYGRGVRDPPDNRAGAVRMLDAQAAARAEGARTGLLSIFGTGTSQNSSAHKDRGAALKICADYIG